MTSLESAATTPSLKVTDEPDAPRRLTEPADGVPQVAANREDIAAVASLLAQGSGPVAIDAERASGYRYGQRAYLVQFRREGSGTHLIDPTTVPGLDAIQSAISGTEWIFHAASQDLPCLAEIGLVPQKIFDTEVAARLLGKPRVGLAALTEAELGITLAKAHSAADWSRRPLPDDWLRYAALDVELLGELRERLSRELVAQGRWQWAAEEFEHIMTMPSPAKRTQPWRKTSGIHKVRTPRGLAVVCELWLARDRLAAERDVAVGRVLPDAAICAAANALPPTRTALGELPEFRGRGVKRNLNYWWEAVDRGLLVENLPDLKLATPGLPAPRTWPDRNPPAADRLARARGAIAQLNDELGIPVENIVAPEAVRRLCWDPPEPLSTRSCAARLAELGARVWQTELAAPVLCAAIGENH